MMPEGGWVWISMLGEVGIVGSGGAGRGVAQVCGKRHGGGEAWVVYKGNGDREIWWGKARGVLFALRLGMAGE